MKMVVLSSNTKCNIRYMEIRVCDGDLGMKLGTQQ